jgi:hypothetical protein
MTITSTLQILESGLSDYHFDIFVGASGYESRATHAISRIPTRDIPAKVAFGFEDRITPQREDNDKAFDRLGVRIVSAKGDLVTPIRDEVRGLITDCKGETPRLFVDYASMTRCWYAGIIEAIRGLETKERVECMFSYSPAIFSEPAETAPNSVVGPIPGFCSLDVPDKPSALVIGLGYERERALGLLEYIDPAVAFAFYTDPALDSKFRDAVLANNAGLLRSLPKDRLYPHPLNDLQRTGNVLLSLCGGLREDYRIVLAPLGVKPFSLLCLLLAARFRDLDVWRVSACGGASVQDRKALGPLLILRVVFDRNPV